MFRKKTEIGVRYFFHKKFSNLFKFLEKCYLLEKFPSFQSKVLQRLNTENLNLIELLSVFKKIYSSVLIYFFQYTYDDKRIFKIIAKF